MTWWWLFSAAYMGVCGGAYYVGRQHGRGAAHLMAMKLHMAFLEELREELLVAEGELLAAHERAAQDGPT